MLKIGDKATWDTNHCQNAEGEVVGIATCHALAGKAKVRITNYDPRHFIGGKIWREITSLHKKIDCSWNAEYPSRNRTLRVS